MEQGSLGWRAKAFLLVIVVFALSPMTTSFVSANGLDKQEVSGSSGIHQYTHGVNDRVKAASKKQTLEPADAVLIRASNWKWNRYVKHALNLPDWIDLGLSHRTRFAVYDHPWRSSQFLGRTDPQIEQRSRIRFGLNGSVFKFVFEGQDSRTHLDDPGDFVDTSIVNQMDILQLLVSATVHNVFGSGLRADAHVGRLTMDFGRRWLIARNGMRNTTNAFDGMHGQIASRNWRIRAFLVEPVLRDDVQLDEQSKRNVFWGIYGETSQVQWLRLNLYYFGLNDQRNRIVARQRTFSTFGLRLYEKPKKGWMDYSFETIWQRGKRGTVDHLAHFQHIHVGYTFNLPWSPRVVIHYDYASGDNNPTDGRDTAFDTLFGARHPQFNPIANFGPFFPQNISSPGWRMLVVPHPGWKLMFKHRVWYLATARGSFGGQPFVTATNGVLLDATGGSGNFIGHDIDTRVQWKINDNWNFDAGYTHWFKGSYFDRLPASAGLPSGGATDTDFFYIETTFRI